jgi:hypothetical protein
MVSKTMQCGFESHPGHRRSTTLSRSSEARPQGRGVTNAVHPQGVGPPRRARRTARHDYHHVAFITAPDLQQCLLHLADHRVGVPGGWHDERLRPQLSASWLRVLGWGVKASNGMGDRYRASRRTGPAANVPSRIFGPCRSMSTPTLCPAASDAARTHR